MFTPGIGELLVILVIFGSGGLAVIGVVVYMVSGLGERRRLREEVGRLTDEVRNLRQDRDQQRQTPTSDEK